MDLKPTEPNVETVDRWFMKEVYLWRKAGSVFWFLTCFPVCTVIYIFVAYINIFQPVQAIIDFLVTIFTPSTILRLLFILLMNGCLVSYSSALFKVKPEIGGTRLDNYVRLVRVNYLSHIGAYCFTGFVVVWCSSGFIGKRYSNLTQSTDGLVIQLNEHHLFLVLYGLFLGISYYCKFHLNNGYYLQFPFIQREKFFQVRNTVGSLFICCINQTLKEVKYYYLFYYLLGGTARQWIAFNLNLQYSSSDSPLDTIFGLFNFHLFWQVIVFGVYVNFSWSLAHLLFKIYQTEHYVFPVESVFDNNKFRCLHDALNCNLQPLVKYLGYFDLCYLARYSIERRQQLFCLSQPGGHPHAWNRISAACLAELNDLNCQIETANWMAYSNVPVKQSSVADKSHVQGDSLNGSMFYRSHEQTTINQNNTTSNIDNTKSKELASKQTTSLWKDKFLALLGKKPVIGYFMGELPDAKSRQLFASSQIHIWAVEALSYLISASYTEDSYGIVQRSLPAILTSLLTLQENVEKHFKLVSPLLKRTQKDILTVNDAMLRNQLQAVLKSSIHRIINKFGKHIRDLPMDNDCVKKLRTFIEYKE